MEESLNQLPDLVADSLLEWRKATIDRQKILAVTYLKFRGELEKRTVSEIEAMVDKDDACYKAKLDEAVKEAEHTRLLERLYAVKRTLAARAAF